MNLYIVLGGELDDPQSNVWRDISKLHFAGATYDEKQAKDIWKAHAQRTVDNALMRYRIITVPLIGGLFV